MSSSTSLQTLLGEQLLKRYEQVPESADRVDRVDSAAAKAVPCAKALQRLTTHAHVLHKMQKSSLGALGVSSPGKALLMRPAQRSSHIPRLSRRQHARSAYGGTAMPVAVRHALTAWLVAVRSPRRPTASCTKGEHASGSPLHCGLRRHGTGPAVPSVVRFVSALRRCTGRPHWVLIGPIVVLQEAHSTTASAEARHGGQDACTPCRLF